MSVQSQSFRWPVEGNRSILEGDLGDELHVLGPLVWGLYSSPESDRAPAFCMATERIVVELPWAASHGDEVARHQRGIFTRNHILLCTPGTRLQDRLRIDSQRPLHRQIAMGTVALDIIESIAQIFPQPIRMLHVMAADLKNEANSAIPISYLNTTAATAGACLGIYAGIQKASRGKKWFQDIPKKKGDSMSDFLSSVIRGTFAEYYLFTRAFPDLPCNSEALAEAEHIIGEFPALMNGHDFIHWMPTP